MRIKIIIGLAVLIIALSVVAFLCGFPIVLNGNQKELININDTTQVKFNPLENIDFSTGDNVAYLLLDKADIKELPLKMSKSKLLECRSNETLQNLKRDFVFEKSNGDMATCESKILIYKGSKLVFCSSFVLTDSIVGMQNNLVGWADAQNKERLKNGFIKFKPINKPIVKL
jgi:hypothetical protein